MKNFFLLLLCLIQLTSNAKDFCSDIKNDHLEFKNLSNQVFAINNNVISFFDSNYNLTKEITLNDKIIDIQFYQNEFFVLSTSKILILDSNYNEIETIEIKTNVNSKYDLPTSFAINNDKIFIGHGEMQLVAIDRKTLVHENFQYQLPHSKLQRSKVTGIVIHETNLIMLLDNITYDFNTNKRAFEGVLIISLNNLTQSKAISIRQELEAHHEGSLFISNGKLYSQHLHIMFELDINKLLKGKYFYPQRRLYNFDGKTIFGRATILNNSVVGCFKVYQPDSDSFKLSFETFDI